MELARKPNPVSQPANRSQVVATSSTLTESLLSAPEGTPIAKASTKQISKLWNDLIWQLGVNTTRPGEQGMADQLMRMTEWVYRRHPNTTLESIRLAYDLAIDGKLGIEIISALNPLQFGKVMSAYEQYRSSNTTIQQQGNNQVLFCELPATPQYIDNVMREAFGLAYRAVAEGDTYPDLGNGLYDWLDEKKLIPFTNEQKWEFFKRAKGDIQQLMSARLDSSKHLSSYQKAPLRKALKTTLSDALDQAANDRIRAQAKYLALNQLLADLVEMECTPLEFFEPLTAPDHAVRNA
jgi:hypothetical protein